MDTCSEYRNTSAFMFQTLTNKKDDVLVYSPHDDFIIVM